MFFFPPALTQAVVTVERKRFVPQDRNQFTQHFVEVMYTYIHCHVTWSSCTSVPVTRTGFFLVNHFAWFLHITSAAALIYVSVCTYRMNETWANEFFNCLHDFRTRASHSIQMDSLCSRTLQYWSTWRCGCKIMYIDFGTLLCVNSVIKACTCKQTQTQCK